MKISAKVLKIELKSSILNASLTKDSADPNVLKIEEHLYSFLNSIDIFKYDSLILFEIYRLLYIYMYKENGQIHCYGFIISISIQTSSFKLNSKK